MQLPRQPLHFVYGFLLLREGSALSGTCGSCISQQSFPALSANTRQAVSDGPFTCRHEKVEEAKREARRQLELERRFNKEGDGSDESDVDEDKILDEEEAGM